MNMIKTLVATALLSVSFAASAAVTLTTAPTNTFFSGNGKLSQDGKAGTTFSFATATQHLDAGFFTSESFVTISSSLNDKLSNLTAWYQVGADKYALTFNKANGKLFTGTFANDTVFKTGDYTLHIAGNLLSKGTGNFSYSTVTAPVPEPETYALMGLGLVGLLAARRRKASK